MSSGFFLVFQPMLRAVILKILILPLISEILSLFSRPFRTVPTTHTITDITNIFRFHSFFSSLARSKFLSSFSFLFILWWFGDPLVSQCPRKFFASHFLGYILVCVYIIYQHGKILVSYTIPIASPFSPSHTYSCIPFLSVYCIRLSL